MWETLRNIVGSAVLVCTGILYVLFSLGLILKGLMERIVCRKKNTCTNKRCPFYPDCFRAVVSDEEWEQVLVSLQNKTKEND